MALSVKQSNMILQLLSNRLSGERDVIKISQILKEFEAAFIVDIPTWRYDLAEYLKKELLEGINQFLADLPETERKIFMYRYWNLDSIERISKRYGYSTSKVTSMLYRTRGKFRKFLETEEYL